MQKYIYSKDFLQMNPKPNMTLLSAIMYNFWHVILPKLKKNMHGMQSRKIGPFIGNTFCVLLNFDVAINLSTIDY